jgi:hypothetical protein
MARGIDPAVAAHLNRALSTLIAQQPSAAVPEITRLQAALREHERIPILTMEATSTQAPLKTEQPESTIKAKILTLFQPFTMSVAMKILIEGHSEPAALKLFDRRLGSALRISDEIASWNEERESKYHEFIRSGDADKYINYLNNDNESSDDSGEDENTWTPGQEEAFLQDKCHDLYNSELAAYHALSFLQGHCVPKLLATVTHYPLPATSDPLIAKHTAIHGLLLSYIPGFTLDQLPQHVPRALWQRICDDAVRAVNACSDHDILNGDVRPENCIVQCTRHPVSAESGSANRIIYRPFIIDFGMTRLRRPGESDEQWRRAKREVDEEDRMGVAMMGSLERAHGAGGYVYERSGRYQRTREEVLGDGLAGSRRANDREVVVRDGEDSPVYQRVVLVDAHEDLESEEEELGELDTEMEGTLVDADGGFKRACPLSAAEARVLGIHTADQGH